MMYALLLFVICAGVDALYFNNELQERKLLCYVGSWTAYSQGYTAADVDPFLCTHLLYAFAGLDSTTYRIKSLDPWLDLCDGGGKCGFQKFVALKQKNPHLKTLLAIGGWNEGSTKYSEMAMQQSTRKTFIDSCIAMLLDHGFDGLDLDWEYPAKRGGKPQDKKNFRLLVQEMKEEFINHGLLVTAAVAAGKNTIDVAYDVPELIRYLDFVSLMTYDYHGSWEPFTHHHSPIQRHPQDSGSSTYLNVKWTVEYWLSLGAPADKLVLGIPVYGRSYTLSNKNEKGLRAPATKGRPGPNTREAGILAYNEICEIQQDTGSQWTVSRDSYLVSPYAVFKLPSKMLQWVGYDDPISVAEKATLASSYGLGGAMVWSLEMDDFKGSCNKGSYPLVNIIKTSITASNLTTTNPTSTTMKLHPPTRAPPTKSLDPPTETPNHPVCKTEGVNADPTDCSAFYVCENRSGVWTIYTFRCPKGLAFSGVHLVCDWPENVDGC